jgi:hypothetical protein
MRLSSSVVTSILRQQVIQGQPLADGDEVTCSRNWLIALGLQGSVKAYKLDVELGRTKYAQHAMSPGNA